MPKKKKTIEELQAENEELLRQNEELRQKNLRLTIQIEYAKKRSIKRYFVLCRMFHSPAVLRGIEPRSSGRQPEIISRYTTTP